MPTVRIGDKIPLSLKLPDQNTGKYVRAFLTDQSGAALAASPIDLSHIDLGLYEDRSLDMPLTDNVTGVYIVYNDAGFSEVASEYGDSIDLFELHVPDLVILEKLNQIIAKLNGLSLPGASINAKLVQNVISDIISDVGQAKALLTKTEIKTTLTENQKTAGAVDADEIAATVCKKC